jgi:hypothetical protein
VLCDCRKRHGLKNYKTLIMSISFDFFLEVFISNGNRAGHPPTPRAKGPGETIDYADGASQMSQNGTDGRERR